jgi:NAD(P)-dependent dehydrogenase (short-subunit alcohol dehydrogenase family)
MADRFHGKVVIVTASITDEKWRKVMSTDVDGVFYGCRAAPSMRGAEPARRRRAR